MSLREQSIDFLLSFVSEIKSYDELMLVTKKKKSRQKMFVKLLFSDWLANELRVQRSEDALSDPER